jgi:NAD(P)-dependent dehydrogenase (short-subunit alcohol dehydrogenase family)
MLISNSACLVTGGGSGLGEATALELVGRGANIAILDVQDVVDDGLREAGVLAIKVDITDELGVQAAIDRTVDHLAASTPA